VKSTPPHAPGAPAPACRSILLAALLHAAAYLVLLPPWMGEDEPWHVEYAHHVAAGHRPWGGIEMTGVGPDKDYDDRELMSVSQLQVRRRVHGVTAQEIADTQLELLDSMRAQAFWQRVDFMAWGAGALNFDQVQRDFTATHQPPPYYLVAGALLGALRIEDVVAQLQVLRFLSVACYLALVAAAWALGRHVARDPWIAAGCALFVAWLPMHARQAAVVNNDVLAKVLAGSAIALAAGMIAGRGGPRRMLGLVALLALALATKTTAAGALAAGVPALAVGARRRLGRLARVAFGLGSVVALAAGATAYWYGTHNPGLPLTLGNLQMRLAGASRAFREDLWRTFVGAFNWYSRDLPPWVYVAVAAGMGLAGAGALVASVWRSSGARRGLMLLCWATIACQVVLIALRGVAAGRYFMPVLPALGALVAAGLCAPLPARLRPRAAAGLCAALVLYDGVFLWSGLVLNQYARWGA